MFTAGGSSSGVNLGQDRVHLGPESMLVLLTSAPSTQGHGGTLGSSSLSCHSSLKEALHHSREGTGTQSQPTSPAATQKKHNSDFMRNIQSCVQVCLKDFGGMLGGEYYYIVVIGIMANKISIFLLHRV